ncbi:MAG: hypothetical protein H0W74_04415 [Sphingosinicella sp.]|nr:hypothetical protein [Sphingosinicella sp.]
MDSLGTASEGGDPGGPGDIDLPSTSRLDDRRVQIRAYRRWVSALRGRRLPSIQDMDPASLNGPHSLLLDLRGGNHNPVMARIGQALREPCGEAEIHAVRDVPADSLLSRLTGHYPAILATGEPLAFEGEQMGPTGERILYRAILLPLSDRSDRSDRIDFIAGMLTWREFADSEETAAIAFEVGQALAGFRQGPHAGWSAAIAASVHQAAHRELPLSA